MTNFFLNPQFINTSEAYSGEILCGNNKLVIPYIGVTLMPDNPINKHQCNVEFSYCIFSNIYKLEAGVDNLAINVVLNSKIKNNITEYVMISSLKQNIGAELKITCREFYFYFPENSSIDFKRFIPFDTPNFKSNMNDNFVKAFFENINLPEKIKTMLTSHYYKIMF